MSFILPPPRQFQSTPPSREATWACGSISSSRNISIHASLAGGDFVRGLCYDSGVLFQSTPPSREATAPATIQPSIAAFQSTPPSREATPACPQTEHIGSISIHASLAGGDRVGRLPAVRDTHISIHASLAGGDRCVFPRGRSLAYFNPRLPRGRRRPDG